MKIIKFALVVLVVLLAGCDTNDVAPTGIPPVATATGTIPSEIATPSTPAQNTGTVSVGSEVPVTVTQGLTMTLMAGFPSGIKDLAWSPDGTLLAMSTGGIGSPTSLIPDAENNIWVWRPDGTLAGTWFDPQGRVTRLAWSPDGMLLASGDAAGNVILFTKDGTQQETLQTEAGVVFGLDWSPDGQKLAVGSVKDTSNNTAQIWTRSGVLRKTMHTKYSGGKFYNLEWSPDGKYLAGGATDYALWDAEGNVIATTTSCPHCTPAWGMAWSPDSKFWATGDENGYVAIYNTAGSRTSTFNTRSGANVMEWSPDGTKIVVSSEVWSPDGTQIGTLPAMGTYVGALAWSPDGQMIAAGNGRNVVAVFTADRQQLYRFALGATASEPPSVNRLAWSPDGKILAAGYSDRVARLWRIGR